MAVESLTQKEVFKYLRPDQVHILSDASEIVNFKAGDCKRRGKSVTGGG